MLETNMDYKGFVLIILGILVLFQNGEAVRLTIEPNPVTLGGTDSDFPTTQELVIECTPDNTGSVKSVIKLFLKRGNYRFALITNTDSSPKISEDAPTDIRTKNPRVEGSIGGASNSVLRVRFQVSSLTCTDEGAYSCDMTYFAYDDNIIGPVSDTETLTMYYLPGNLQITASKTVNGMPLPAQNQSTVQDNDALEYRCTGTMGKSTTALIEWYRLVQSTNMFVRFTPSGVGDSVDDGQISTNVCPYSRTSTLRYRVTNTDRNYIVFRCQVTAQQSNGEIQTAYSHQYSFRPPSFVTSGSPSLLCFFTTTAAVALSSIRAAMLVT